MYRSRLAIGARAFFVFAVLGMCVLPLMTGCDLIDQLLGGGIPGGGTANAPQAVITAEIDDDLVNRGLNPDLRPPLGYEFSAWSSLDQYGDPIHRPNYEAAWDFGDGGTRAFEWNDYSLHYIYREEGTYTATLTLRDAPGYGDASDTAQKTITIGPAWLEIISIATADRPDGRVDVTVVVRNQSPQALHSIQVDLLVDGSIWPSNLSATFESESPLSPGGSYTLYTSVGKWTGTLTARSSWCYQ